MTDRSVTISFEQADWLRDLLKKEEFRLLQRRDEEAKRGHVLMVESFADDIATVVEQRRELVRAMNGQSVGVR